MEEKFNEMLAMMKELKTEVAELRKEVNKPKKATSDDAKTDVKRPQSNWAKTHGIYLTPAMKDGELRVRQTLTDEDNKHNVARATWDGYVFTATYEDGTTKEYENVSEFARDHKKRLGNYSEKTIASTNGWDDVKYEHAENKWRSLDFLRPEGAKADKSRSASRGRSKTPTPKKKTTGAGATPDASTASPATAPKPTGEEPTFSFLTSRKELLTFSREPFMTYFTFTNDDLWREFLRWDGDPLTSSQVREFRDFYLSHPNTISSHVIWTPNDETHLTLPVLTPLISVRYIHETYLVDRQSCDVFREGDPKPVGKVGVGHFKCLVVPDPPTLPRIAPEEIDRIWESILTLRKERGRV